MWIKVLVCLALVAFCCGFGYFLAGKYRARKKFYSQLFTFNERYLTELAYARKPLGEFLKSQEYKGDFQALLTEYYTKRTIEMKLSYLSKDERTACGEYLSMLGKGDAISQKNFYSTQKNLLEAKAAETDKEAKSKEGLYLKLGLLAGLALVILII